ncbi:MAG: hypothetical protein ACR2KM_08720, partial [Gemmatimonadaceae bacterium]
MPTPFDAWTYEDAAQVMAQSLARPEYLAPGQNYGGSMQFTSTALVTSITTGEMTAYGAGSGSYGGLGQLSTLAMIRVNRAFLYGDHWQGGYGWIGPMPQGNDPGFA